MSDIIVVLTILGNLILALLLVGRGWSGRLQWLTVTTILAVVADGLFYWVHGFAHALYAPARIFLIYWLFPILELCCAWEAYRVKLKWLEYLMLIQVGLAVVSCAAHLHGDPTAIYELEIFDTWFNIGGIVWCIVKFRKEPNYAR